MTDQGGVCIGIVGAGMAGLACATELNKQGIPTVLFDKGRGPGGRMATRRAEHDGEMLFFDHGAQYFTAHDSTFTATIGKWLARGVVANWPAAGENAYVGIPGMNGPLKHMAKSLDVRWGTRITQVRSENAGWLLEHDGGAEKVSHCVCAIPAEQTADLLSDVMPDMARFADGVVSDPCWTVMAAFDRTLPIDTDTIWAPKADVSWASRNSAKPDRSGPESWVIQASAVYSREHLEDDAAVAAPKLLARFFEEAGITAVTPTYLTAHRWRYSMPRPNATPRVLWDEKRRIGAAGDWLVKPKVEGAWLSGRAMAEAVVAAL
ncbi:NAD(P)-binding protein [Altererythrobacter sp. RZ02]|uniref:NAD(P)-binding protein n=1 Tax=Pontixanthobacter rizhaonensis TaxID=2730337 RepID=A0A848QRT4_9SPHN|nr:FAD-dependent oxidoreductase [Pontixanthobacter rizhaonensis]NMW31818.1 NAD(P)-binding protein [Pontixanthobacter rizhaonensis]